MVSEVGGCEVLIWLGFIDGFNVLFVYVFVDDIMIVVLFNFEVLFIG